MMMVALQASISKRVIFLFTDCYRFSGTDSIEIPILYALHQELSARLSLFFERPLHTVVSTSM